ncbi:alpha/beta hydrolase-fold protein [Hymenobacter arizonensis]|uniref:Alpha/beta hydrolase family protein n=1 Tax=Hymenobacter arizonensis TaxID=1227077 RepID=A0A1I5V9J7_HYMAR|nr:alpha/beta hydrolase-fold protein [Hymenobacter arizonensis]SFQ04169.1 Alpha/beta hydrolase family protein [Hymenobacter arizonensis]
MKPLLLLGITYALLAGRAASAQAQAGTSTTYEHLMEQGGAQLQAQNPCSAAALFEQAFARDSTRANEFELFGAATAAAACPARRALAWRWLGQLSRHRPLRMTPKDLDNVSQDPALAPLQAEAAWPRWLAAMRLALAEQAAAANAAQARWLRETQARALPSPASSERKRGKMAAAQPGYALYFSTVPNDTVRMPYLVRVPAGYSPAKPAPVVVYLHGGIVSTPQFGHTDPDVVEEPIFAAAPSNALVVYPFGRQSFGWVKQPAAFAQIVAVVREVQARYRTDPRGPVLGGMSNGGSAALWFASQRPDAFCGFYALSPAPELPLGASIGRLGQGKPCLQFSAEDDTLYPYAAVQAAHAAHRAQAPGWELQAVPKGGHGFLYRPDGPAVLRQALARLCPQP